MLSVFVAIMAVYVMLLGFVLYGGWSNLKFAIGFRKGINFWTKTACKTDHDEMAEGKFSILHGQFQTPPVKPKSKVGRGMLRHPSTQKYYDNRYFTSLSSEKKELQIKPQDEALNFLRERGDFKSKLGYFKAVSAQGLNLEPLDEAGSRRREGRQPSLEAYLAYMNFNSGCATHSPLQQRQQGPGCSQPALSGLCFRTPMSQTGNKKVRLSRGLLRPRRRPFGNRVESRDLSVIPERDESEERTSINVSGTRFKCQASDNGSIVSSPALC